MEQSSFDCFRLFKIHTLSMNEFEDISFKAVDAGAGFYQETPKAASFYEDKDEDRLLSSNSVELFHGLDPASPQFYEQLTQRLERPILDSFQKQKRKKHSNPGRQRTPVLEKIQAQREVRILREEKSPLNSINLPPWPVMKVDFAFTGGLYSIALAGIGVFFNIQTLPSPFLMAYGFGLFHQLYTIICRSLIGSTLGEEKYNMIWEEGSALRFILRGLIVILTGFITLPLLSALFKRDLLEDCTQIRLQYNI